MKNKLRVISGALAAAIFVVPIQSAQAADATGELKIVSANLGSGDSYAAAMAVDSMQAQVVTFQEICRSEFEKWQTQYGWYGVFSRKTEWHENDVNRCVGQEKGEAILARPTVVMSNLQVLPLPGDTSGKEYKLTCVDVNGIVGGGHPLKVCTTHLSVLGAQYRDPQLAAAKAWLHPFADHEQATVFTGDLNMTPEKTVLNSIYDRYKEVNFPARVNAAPTVNTGRKIDYIFADRPNLAVRMDQVANGYGDGHNILRGWINY